MPKEKDANSCDTANARCALALLLVACVAGAVHAQEAPSRTTAQSAATGITYVDGMLRINVADATLAEVLAKVAALTGVKIDVPDGARNERMPIVELGPAPAREVLASLLSDSNFDYLIQAADADRTKLQSVLLLPRDKKGAAPAATELASAARPGRSPYARPGAAPAPEETPAAESSAPAQPEIAAATPPASEQPAASQPEPTVAAVPDAPLTSTPTLPPQPGAYNPLNPPPPQVLSPENMSQQLQQMYQQRMQMIQQSRQAAPSPNPVGK